MKTYQQLLVFAALMAVLLIAFSPEIEAMQDAIVFDAAITKTCFDRHGYNFISRWSCRSSLHQVGLMGLGVTCGLGKGKGDICVNLDKMSADNKRQRESQTQEAATDNASAANPADTAKLPQDNVAKIKQECAARWPSNFDMRLFCEDQQYAALKKLIERGSIKPQGEPL